MLLKQMVLLGMTINAIVMIPMLLLIVYNILVNKAYPVWIMGLLPSNSWGSLFISDSFVWGSVKSHHASGCRLSCCNSRSIIMACSNLFESIESQFCLTSSYSFFLNVIFSLQKFLCWQHVHFHWNGREA